MGPIRAVALCDEMRWVTDLGTPRSCFRNEQLILQRGSGGLVEVELKSHLLCQLS